MNIVKSLFRLVLGQDGNPTLVQNVVKAENVIDAGDLNEVGITEDGVALLVGTDGKLRRTTVGTLVSHFQDTVNGHTPYIQDGHWMTWDSGSGAYVQSEAVLQGPPGVSVNTNGVFSFHVDSNGHLIMSYADGDNPPLAEINEEGHLLLTL